MTGRRALVKLGEVVVGRLVEDAQAWIEFRVDPAYRASRPRPVLGQWFEDDRKDVQRGDRPGLAPPFFANLIPEGDLRSRVADRLGLDLGDDLGFLCAVGQDLPGALTIEAEGGEPAARPPVEPSSAVSAGLRFSLAGVQLKFSLVRGADRFHLPGAGERGAWIAKISYAQYPELAANEWVTMEWARRLGFDVPATELRPLTDLVDVPHDGEVDGLVFLIARYDRTPDGRRIHQEDFQQIVGRRPDKKYDDLTYDKLTRLAMAIVGPEAYDEVIRRLAFIAASGNDDAHTKNWSVLYPDGIRAALTPLYDQVFTGQWPQFGRELALKLDGTKHFAELDLRHFRELARRLGNDPDRTADLAASTVAQAATVWRELRDHPNVTVGYREALGRHWSKVPLLRAQQPRI
jgi:serine/threonine-protein kinase HipA